MDAFCFLYPFFTCIYIMMDANIIIVGAGCAGMQLINALLKLPAEQTGDILLIESNRQIIHKSWCFWTHKPSEYDFLISKHWSELKFGSSKSNSSSDITPYRYNYINSELFFEYHNQLISSTPRVKVIHEEVTMFKSDSNVKQVHTQNNVYQAQHVYSSIIDYSIIENNKIMYKYITYIYKLYLNSKLLCNNEISNSWIEKLIIENNYRDEIDILMDCVFN